MIISKKDKTTAGILGILLGGFGVHRMYMGFIGIGLLQLILTILTLGIAAVWGLIEGILILVQDDWTDSEGQLLKGNERGQQAYYDGVSRGLKPPVGGSKPQVGGNNNKFQQLKELNELKEQGIITQEEFEQEKRKIL